MTNIYIEILGKTKQRKNTLNPELYFNEEFEF